MSRKKKRPGPKRTDVPHAELVWIVERAKTAPLDEAGYVTLKAAIDTLSFLTQ